MTDIDMVIYQGSEDWSALYKDDKLLYVGDHYLVAEKVYIELGIALVDSDAFMRGGSKYNDVAKTLQEIHQYQADKTINKDRANKLREQAQRLLQEAEALDD